MKERDVVIDIESCVDHTLKEGTAASLAVSVEELALATGKTRDQPSSAKSVGGGGVLPEAKKEKSKSMSAKKPPKPPRPPRGLSLDAADQRLIKELSELAMIKRARMERIKVLKKMKAAKAASTSSTSASAGNWVAMLFTILFCIAILFRGCHPPGILRKTPGNIVMVVDTHEQHATLWGRVSQRNKTDDTAGFRQG